MTDKLEKTFFDTFGIEPKIVDTAVGRGFCIEHSRVDKYPQITDHVLLELICILTEWRTYLHSSYVIKANNTLNLKQDVLKDFLELFKWYEFKKCDKDIKQQVQAIFDEVKS